MEYRRLGRSGLQLSGFSLGAWVTFGTSVDVQAASDCMAVAYDAGVNFFDNAEGYGNGQAEIIMGQALKRLGWRRDSYCVSSKVMFGSVPDPAPTQRGLSRKHVIEACEQALERLGLDYLDLYFCHRPDPRTPIEETVRAMHTLVMQGKILYWGTSEWPAERIERAYKLAYRLNLTPPSMEQPQYNLFTRTRVEQEYAPLFEERGMGTTAWSPLCSGVLTGKYANGIPAGSRASLPGYEWLSDSLHSEQGKARAAAAVELAALAADLGMPLHHLALAWTRLNERCSTTILGASSVAQLRDNLGAVDAVAKLTPEVVTRIEAILAAHPAAELAS